MLAIGVGLSPPARAGEPAKSADQVGSAQAQSAGAPAAKVMPAPADPSSSGGDAAKEGAAAIAEARRAVEDQRYDDALALLAPHVSSPDRAVRAQALEVTAIVRLLVGRTAEGREAVAALHELAPAFELDDPSLPPRVTKAFEAERALPHGRAITLSIRPAASERGLFDLSAAEPARSVDLSCSSASPPSFSPVAVSRAGGAFQFRLPVLAAHRCFAIARDADGLPLARLGSAAHPVDVAPPPPAPAQLPVEPTPPIVRRWWFWTAIGVAAAGVGIGIAVGLRKPAAAPDADITLKPQGAVLSW